MKTVYRHERDSRAEQGVKPDKPVLLEVNLGSIQPRVQSRAYSARTYSSISFIYDICNLFLFLCIVPCQNV
jgi:hypothetical protein